MQIPAFVDSVNILLLILFLAACIFFVIYLRKSIRKAQAKLLEIDKNTELNADKFNIMISKKIETDKKASFTLFQLEVQDVDGLKKSYGDMQYFNALQSLINSLKSLLGVHFKIFKYSDDTVFLYSKYNISGEHLKETSKKIIILCQKSIILAGALTMEFDVNLGIVSYPGCGNSLEEIKQNLLIALVSAKRKGYNTFAVYDAQLGNRQTEEYKNYLEIKNAISNREFTLYYQPIVNLSTMQAEGAETLIRWEHKTQGTLSPGSFLSIMEKSGDINWVGFWSFEQLVKQSLAWKNNYPDRKLILSMNLSPKQLLNPGLCDEIRRMVKRYKINTSEYCMEIVQFALFDKFDIVQENIIKLTQMGFKIAVDNFGMEFSTLQIFDKFKLSYIKLNKNFINDTTEKEISKNIAEMLIKYAKENNISIIAEGIENEEMLTYIKNLGIIYGQGYYFSMPKKPKEFIKDVIIIPWENK